MPNREPKLCAVCGLPHLTKRTLIGTKSDKGCIRAMAHVLAFMDRVIMQLPGGPNAVKRCRLVLVAKMTRTEGGDAA